MPPASLIQRIVDPWHIFIPPPSHLSLPPSPSLSPSNALPISLPHTTQIPLRLQITIPNPKPRMAINAR